MRRVLAIAALVAMMLAGGDPAMAQTPNMPKQPRIQSRVPQPARPPSLPLIKPSQALIIALRMVPNSKGLNVELLPGGNYAVTLKRKDQVQRLIIDGSTGVRR